VVRRDRERRRKKKEERKKGERKGGAQRQFSILVRKMNDFLSIQVIGISRGPWRRGPGRRGGDKKKKEKRKRKGGDFVFL